MLLQHFPIILKTQKTQVPGFGGVNYFFNWRIIALQCCVGFYHTTPWVSHKYTNILSLLSLPPTPQPHYTPLGCHRAPRWLPVPTSKFPLAICFTYDNIYVSVLFSQFVPPSSPAVSISLFSMYLYSYSTNRFISTIYLDSIYMS